VHLSGRAPAFRERLHRSVDDPTHAIGHVFSPGAASQDGAEREYVRPTVDRLSPPLLGSAEAQLVWPYPGDTKAGESDGLRWFDGDSARRDSTVYDAEEPSVVVAACVCVGKCERHLGNHPGHVAPRQSSVPQKRGAQSRSRHMFHCDVAGSSVHPDIENMRDARVRKSRGAGGLGGDGFELASIGAVQHYMLLKSVGTPSHREECTPDLAVAKPTQ
jgi:hypothetical protein